VKILQNVLGGLLFLTHTVYAGAICKYHVLTEILFRSRYFVKSVNMQQMSATVYISEPHMTVTIVQLNDPGKSVL